MTKLRFFNMVIVSTVAFYVGMTFASPRTPRQDRGQTERQMGPDDAHSFEIVCPDHDLAETVRVVEHDQIDPNKKVWTIRESKHNSPVKVYKAQSKR